MRLLVILILILTAFLTLSTILLDNLNNLPTKLIGLTQEILILFMFIILASFIKNKKIKSFIIFTFFAIFYTIYTLQTLSLYLTGDVLNIASFANATQAYLLLNSSMILKIAIALIIFWGFIKLINSSIDTKFIVRVIIFFIILGSYMELIKYKHSLGKIDTLMPIKSFYETAKNYYSFKKSKVSKLTKDDINLAKKFNIYINLNKKKPFEKDYLYKKDFPFKQISTKKPNIIVFYIESLSARLLEPYNKKMSSVTPNIKDFAKNSMVVKGYYNHATPTAPALYGQNCSLYPLLRYDDFNKEANPLKHLKLNCIANYFKKANYNTVYLTHSRGTYSYIKENLHLWGYQDIFLWKNLLKKYLPNDKELILGETGLSDHQMMRALVNFLKENNSSKPLFLGVSTIETHIGFEPNSTDGLKYKDGSSNTLNMIYNFDDAFKIFWDYFKNSKYYKNSIVILTADHALYPNIDYKKVAGDDWISSVYDKISLIIYDPIHKMPKNYSINASSIDLAPTLAHLANLPKSQKNSFLGTSIFDTKEYNNSFGISAYRDFNFYIDKNSSVVNVKIKYVDDKELKKEYNSLKNIMKFVEYLQNVGRF